MPSWRAESVHSQRTCEVAPDLGPAGRGQCLDEAAGLEVRERGESAPRLGAEEGRCERVPMTAVLVAVERQHARAEDPGGREALVVDGEQARIAHHIDAEIPTRH